MKTYQVFIKNDNLGQYFISDLEDKGIGKFNIEVDPTLYNSIEISHNINSLNYFVTVLGEIDFGGGIIISEKIHVPVYKDKNILNIDFPSSGTTYSKIITNIIFKLEDYFDEYNYTTNIIPVTPTPTSSNTPTPSVSPSISQSVTPTPTPTQTLTASPTPTPTQTQTLTATATPTPTPSVTPSSSQTAQTYADIVSQSSPVAWFRFNEAAPTSSVVSDDGNTTVNLSSDMLATSSLVGDGSLQLQANNGGSATVDLTNGTSGEISIECIFRLDDLNGSGMVFGFGDGFESLRLRADYTVTAYDGTDSNLDISSEFEPNVYKHVVIQIKQSNPSGQEGEAYIDGAFIGNFQTNSSVEKNSNATIGDKPYNLNDFITVNVDFDELIFYDSALTPTEIADRFNSLNLSNIDIPKSVPNLVGQYDASSLNLNTGDDVPGVTDISGNNKNLINQNVREPLYLEPWINGLGGVNFGDTGDNDSEFLAQELMGNIDLENENITIFFVAENSSSSSAERPIGFADRNTSPIWYYATDGTYRFNVGSINIATDPQTPTVYGFVKRGNLYDAYFTGTNQLNGGNLSTGAGLDDDLYVGNTDGNNSNIIFGEILIYQRDLSTSERQKIEGYLAHKWGLDGDLPSGHPYKTNPPSQ